MGLEDEIKKMDKELREKIFKMKDKYFEPKTFPKYKPDYQKWALDIYDRNGQEKPKKFWKITEDEFRGMYVRINVWREKYSWFYTEFLVNYENLTNQNEKDTGIEKRIRIKSLPLKELRARYDSIRGIYKKAEPKAGQKEESRESGAESGLERASNENSPEISEDY